MCDNCRASAAQAADAHAAANSGRLTGHGRKPHGRDASRKAKMYATEGATEERIQAAWQQIYDQTLNRLLKTCKR
jgi:hypothetical protein